jgi:hypothetical protein
VLVAPATNTIVNFHLTLFMVNTCPKRRVAALALCFVVSVGAIALLDVFSSRISSRKNGFIRLLPPHILTPVANKDIGYNSYYIAGTAAQKIYLANTVAPSKFLVTDFALADTEGLTMTFPGNSKIIQGANLIAVDSPYFYLMEGRVALLMRGNIPRMAIDLVKKSGFFTASVPVSPSSFVVRAYNHLQRQNVLAKAFLDTPLIKDGRHTLERQVDGVFSTDGLLNYDPDSKRIIYVYYYRNQLLCFDTALNQLYVSKTIDTISRA